MPHEIEQLSWKIKLGVMVLFIITVTFLSCYVLAPENPPSLFPSDKNLQASIDIIAEHPTAIEVDDAKGKKIVTIDLRDGKVDFGEGYTTPDEASKAFWLSAPRWVTLAQKPCSK